MPRLFVYHAENAENEGFVKVVKVMELKIFKYIGVPAMWATIISGAVMIYLSGEQYGVNLFQTGGWLHAKLLFVAFLIVYFYSLNVMRKRFLNGTCNKSGKFFRIYNEVPTILLLIILLMVVIRPF